MCIVYNCFFKQRRLWRDFVMYLLSSFAESLSTVFSPETSPKTSSPSDNNIALYAYFIITIFCAAVISAGSISSPSNANSHSCCVRRASIFTRHRLKLFLPVNFSTSNFVDDIALIPVCCA